MHQEPTPVEFEAFSHEVHRRVRRLIGAKAHLNLRAPVDVVRTESGVPFLSILGYVRAFPQVELFVRREEDLMYFGVATGYQKIAHQVAAAITRAYGPPVQLKDRKGVFDRVAKFRLSGMTYFAVAPSDVFEEGTPPRYLAGKAATFLLTVGRELRLCARPSAPPKKKAIEITAGSHCPRCDSRINRYAVSCPACMWSAQVARDPTNNAEPTYSYEPSDT